MVRVFFPFWAVVPSNIIMVVIFRFFLVIFTVVFLCFWIFQANFNYATTIWVHFIFKIILMSYYPLQKTPFVFLKHDCRPYCSPPCSIISHLKLQNSYNITQPSAVNQFDTSYTDILNWWVNSLKRKEVHFTLYINFILLTKLCW